MSYRCEVCSRQVKPRQPRLTHVVERAVKDGPLTNVRKEIAAEVAVCQDCHFQLETVGAPLAEVRRARGPEVVPVAPACGQVASVQAQPVLATEQPQPAQQTTPLKERVVNGWRKRTGPI